VIQVHIGQEYGLGDPFDGCLGATQGSCPSGFGVTAKGKCDGHRPPLQGGRQGDGAPELNMPPATGLEMLWWTGTAKRPLLRSFLRLFLSVESVPL